MGDQVTAYDPSTGKSSTQTVQHVWVNHDHDLLDVTLHEDGSATQADAAPDKAQAVATKAHGSQAPPSPRDASDETIHTTEKHPWLTTDRGWVKAGNLRVGEHVVELGGRTVTVCEICTLDAVAQLWRSLGSEERYQRRNAGPGARCPVKPSHNPTEVECRGGGNVLEAGLRKSAVARATQSVAVDRLRDQAFDASAHVVQLEECVCLLALARVTEGFVLRLGW